ncbi:MAG TPA: MopE-related protein [Kofleriaceae bacterium]
MIMLASRAEATVTQVDGTIVPVTNRMQLAIDTYETPAGSIDAVKDAAETFQIFKPRLSSAVVFLDMREGAGFENSFGWYNVGDDVLTAAGRTANLHPVMGCGVPMVAGAGDATHHSGNPAAYVQNAEEPNQISVDFAAEATAGRYKGGFIGFYLITPEDPLNPGVRLAGRAINCGDFKNDSGGKSLFGFIYFTQKDLNNDGDFVHHLVYRSKTPDRFLFGFEDLFRGGDNDYEDMAMRIDGLTPPCLPSAEVCDGIDNDCDGLIDAADPDLTGVGTSCTCDGIALTCDNGPRFGQCQTGVTVCTAGAIACHGTGTPSGEICDGIDNNCDGQIDNNPAGVGAACDGPDSDLCKEGQIVCQNGALVCNDTTGPNVELCNGVDDNCDGQIDEGDPGGGGACGSTIGVCTPGTNHCVGGTLVCQGGNAGGPELCNGLDDNCNGVVDDSPTDVGQPCGTNSTGECRLGQTICTGGSLQCAGEVGPGTERCNGLDDNCNGMIDDNPVDAGQPCGSSVGACRPGVLTCSMGGLVCTGGVGPTAETCNGIDDDCDGVVDDNVTGEGVACGSGSGTCSAGVTRCIAGTMQCVGGTSGGTEVCNGIDDDCDGLIDNGDLCSGGLCDHGKCAAKCVPGEFPCPTGKRCNAQNFCVEDPCYGVSCPNDAAGNLQVCLDGGCQPLCPTIDCPGDLVCRGRDGACVLDTCDYLPKCATDQVCLDGACQANPCNGVTCPGGEFCRGGSCVASCLGVRCSATETCRDGACTPSGCNLPCATDEVCNPDTGNCQPALCFTGQCPQTKVCDRVSGACLPNLCQGVTCPSGQTCTEGQCGLEPHGSLVTTGGSGGCSTGGDGSLGAGLVLLALAWRRRRSRSRTQSRSAAASGLPAAAIAAAVLVAGVAGVAGCKQNNYCLECATGDGGTGSGSGDGGPPDVGPVGCDPNQIHPETCNGVDDNCDGRIDEGFDLQTDVLNCGACGVGCNKPGAQTRCVAGGCAIVGCFPGFSDRDGDTTGPYASSNGCEYSCFQSNGGVEACDELDNNCNGVVDEGFDKTSDPNNCGACGRVCQFFGATGHCTNSVCRFDPATDCLPGFHDLDGVQQNGCEYACTNTNGGVEACDLRDNNCDGRVDETFNFAADPSNCGRCGLVCQFPHATASCAMGVCRFNPALDCQPGFVDANAKQLDGCEYQCTRTNGGVEICDGIDNDCNGVADDNAIDAGGACASTTPPRGACVANGTLTCAAGHLVCTGATEAVRETCNNVDDDCNGTIDNGVTQVCYDGLMGTSGVGVCHPGFATCAAGAFGACSGEVTPSPEQCNGLDDDCNGTVDDAPGGGVITASCYTGPAGTAGVGTCKSGTKTCAFGAFGACSGQVVPASRDLCGDGLDTDCDGKNDTAEGCQVLDAETRLDAGGGTLGEASPGAKHSYDLVFARGGVPLGSTVYATWSELDGSSTEVYFRKSDDGGKTWGTILSVTAGIAGNKVKPALAVAPGATDRIVVAYQTVINGVRDIHVQISADGGATFGAQSGQLNTSGDSFHHVVAIRGNTCVVAWEKLNTSTLNRDVMSRVSTDGCATIVSGTSPEIKINVGSPTTRFAGRPQVGITSTNGVVWAWREQRSNSTRDMFAVAIATPTTALPAADIAIDTDAASESDFPVLQVNETTAYLVWQQVSTSSNGGSDVMFSRSTNGGAAWSAPRVIDDPAAEVSSSFTPTLSVDPRAAGNADDVVAIAWEDRRQGTQIFASVSSDGGATFSTPLRTSSVAGDPAPGASTLPQIAAAGGGVLAVVYQNQLTQSTARPHAFVATSIDTGATWTFTELEADGGAGAAILPQVIASQVAGKPAAVVGWTDFRANQIDGDVYTALSH